LGLALALIRVAASKLPGRLGAPGTLVMNGTVIGFAFGAAVAAAMAFGFLPALLGRRAAPNLSLKRGDRHTSGAAQAWTRGAYVSVQVGLSLVLLVGASLFAESLWNLIKSPLGFAPEHLLTFAVNLPWSDDQSAITSFYRDVQKRIEALPGVKEVGEIDALPTVDWHLRSNFDAEWLPRVPNRPALSAEDRHIAGNYLAAMGTPVLAGRAFTAQDQQRNSHSIMVNRELAQEYLPGGDVVGKHLIGGNRSLEIVGVVADVRGTAGSISKAPGPEVYWPADADEGIVQRFFVVRSEVQPNELINAIREQVRQVDPLQAISNVATMDELLDKSVAQPRLNMALIAAFAVLALLMACVGIYGVVAWSVAHRVTEIGVRMALGATRGEIAWLFVRQAAMPTVAGIAAGTAAALELTQFVRSQLYGVTPSNPWVYAISIPVLLFLVLMATLRPSLRAATVNPVDALRAE
jgi:predicted permease